MSRARKKFAALGSDPIATVWGWDTNGRSRMGRMADKTTGQAKGRTPVAAAPLPAPLASASAGARRGMPLSVVIVRYFAYLAVALCLVWFVTFALFSWMMRLGFVYSANYGSGNVGATV